MARGQERARRWATREWGERRAEGSSVSPPPKASQRPFEAGLLPHPPTKEEGGGMGVGGAPRTGVPGQPGGGWELREPRQCNSWCGSPWALGRLSLELGRWARGSRTAGSLPGSAPGSLSDRSMCPPFLDSISLPRKYPSLRKQDFLSWKGLESPAYERNIKN